MVQKWERTLPLALADARNSGRAPLVHCAPRDVRRARLILMLDTSYSQIQAALCWARYLHQSRKKRFLCRSSFLQAPPAKVTFGLSQEEQFSIVSDAQKCHRLNREKRLHACHDLHHRTHFGGGLVVQSI